MRQPNRARVPSFDGQKLRSRRCKKPAERPTDEDGEVRERGEQEEKFHHAIASFLLPPRTIALKVTESKGGRTARTLKE